MSALDQLFQDYHVAGWAALGLLLVLTEILLIPGFFLSYALSAFVMAGLAALFGHTASMLTEFMVFMLIGTALFLPARWLINRSKTRTSDINQY